MLYLAEDRYGDWGASERHGARIPEDDLALVRRVAHDGTVSWRFPPVHEAPRELSRVLRQLLQDLVRAPPVSLTHGNATRTFAEEIDEEYAAVLLALEDYRSRPAARGVVQRPRDRSRLPLDPWELAANVTATQAPWSVVPRDDVGRSVVSEWLPLRPLPDAEGNCPACEAMLEGMREAIWEGRNCWRCMAMKQDRSPLMAGRAFRGVDTTSRGGLVLDVNSHSCPLGDYMMFPRVLFAPQRRALRVRHLEWSRVRLGLTLHLGIPGGLPTRWTASTFVRMVFPLFGALRFYWGRAVLVSGEVTFSRGPSSSWGQVATQHMLRLGVVFREQGSLEYAPLVVTTTHVEAPRPDITILGASLRWLGLESATPPQNAEPVALTTQEIEEVLDESDVPSSLLSWNRTRSEWEMALPEAPSERCTSRRYLGQREV